MNKIAQYLKQAESQLNKKIRLETAPQFNRSFLQKLYKIPENKLTINTTKTGEWIGLSGEPFLQRKHIEQALTGNYTDKVKDRFKQILSKWDRYPKVKLVTSKIL